MTEWDSIFFLELRNCESNPRHCGLPLGFLTDGYLEEANQKNQQQKRESEVSVSVVCSGIAEKLKLEAIYQIGEDLSEFNKEKKGKAV